MFLHHTMTDAEILRTCDGCDSPHLKLLASRLEERIGDLSDIHRTANAALREFDIHRLHFLIDDIASRSEPE